MQIKVNKYMIGGMIALVLLLIIYNTEVNVHNPPTLSNNDGIIPQVAKQVALTPPPAITNYMSPEAYMRKQLDEHGLPDTDEYMSNELRSQLSQLHSKFYYDNCRYAPLA